MTHLFSDHCGDTAMNGYCTIVVDGWDGRPRGQYCPCEEHEEV